MKQHVVKDICETIYLFFLIFLPNLAGIPARIIFMILNSAIVVLLAVKHGRLIVSMKCLRIFFFFIPFFMYVTVMQCIHCLLDKQHTGAYAAILSAVALPFIYSFIFVLLLINIDSKNRLTFDKFEKQLIIVTCIQFVLVIISFMIPTVKSIFVEIMLRDWQDTEQRDHIYWSTFRRGYGLSTNLFDGFGYIISILISIVFLKGLREKKIFYLILSGMMLFMPLVNARTGVLLTILSMIVIFSFYTNFKNIIRVILLLGTIICVLPSILSLLPKSTLVWVTSGLEETLSLLNSESTSHGVYDEILKNDLVMPDSMLGFVFGMGAQPEVLGNYNGIDSGYVQCIWRFGLVGSLLLYFGYVCLFMYPAVFQKKSKIKTNRCIMTFLTVIFFVYLINQKMKTL